MWLRECISKNCSENSRDSRTGTPPRAGALHVPAARRKTRTGIQLLFWAAVGVLVSGCGNKNMAAPAAPPLNVQVTPVVQRDVPIYHEWVATLDGFVNAQIQPQVSGYLIKQAYQEGQIV